VTGFAAMMQRRSQAAQENGYPTGGGN